jgi:hypothetical protein
LTAREKAGGSSARRSTMWNTGRMAVFFICSHPAQRVNDSNRDSDSPDRHG